MRCEYCQKEFPVEDERLVGQDVKCPHCGIPSCCSDRRVLIVCPACGKELEGELWMLGNQAECTYCGRDIQLSRPPNPGDEFSNSYLPANYTLGNYIILRCIGIGGMGEVYLVRHKFLDRQCALKLFRPNSSGTVGTLSLEALVREAQLACRIHSPFIVDVMDVQLDSDRKFGYIVMEYVQGKDVENIISTDSVSEEFVLNVARGVCQALIAASAYNVVHRDIKPANILITDAGEVKLADLGIAKSGDDTVLPGKSISATIQYASPEQLMSSDSVDCRADIYSLGATMYHMFSGRRPFEGLSTQQAIAKVIKGDLPPLAKIAPFVSRECCDLVAAMMDINVEKRPANAEKLLAMIDAILARRNSKLLSLFSFIPGGRKGLIAAAAAAAFILVAGVILTVMAFTPESKENKSSDVAVKVASLPQPEKLPEKKTPQQDVSVKPLPVPVQTVPTERKADPPPVKEVVKTTDPVKDSGSTPVKEEKADPAKESGSAPVKEEKTDPVKESGSTPVKEEKTDLVKEVKLPPEKASETVQKKVPEKQPSSPPSPPAPRDKGSSKVNFLALLIAFCWFFSGLKVFPYLEKKCRKKDEFVIKYQEYLNLAALVAAPIVCLMVELHGLFAGKFKRTFKQKADELPVIVNSQGQNTFESGDADNEIVYYVRKMFADALKLHASDIFIDPKTGDTSVLRFRVDGSLRVIEEFDAFFGSQVINVLKVAGAMNISERRRPQDGSFSLAGKKYGDISVRAATVGAFSGEKIALRILGDASGPKTLAEAGLTGKDLSTLEQAARLSSGMVLICGPTGSGKTTTLYALLKTIDYSIKNVISIEDPIEHVMPSISQMEVNDSAGIGFAQLLRNSLRQNPDVICLGEIRDEETAQTAIHAAQTGHLIIATLHSNDNIGTIDRLANLNIPLRSIAGTLRLVVSQRLVRKLCTCKKGHAPTAEQSAELERFNIKCGKIYEPQGCSKCGNTGYSGRMALFDILAVDDSLRELLEDDHSNLSSIQKKLKESPDGNVMLRSGYGLVAQGVTSWDEVKRVTMEMNN